MQVAEDGRVLPREKELRRSAVGGLGPLLEADIVWEAMRLLDYEFLPVAAKH